MERCFGGNDPIYAAYHDDEWGRPVTDEKGLYEKICLEGFQTGISWLVILRKREAFRAAFEGFDPHVVASFDDHDVERLLKDAGIVRNRRKIVATITNARATLSLRESGGSLQSVVWSHQPPPSPPPKGFGDLAAKTIESTRLSKELKRHGFSFVGPTTVYAMMQACGVVNDHFADCPIREEVEQARARVGFGKRS